MSMFTSLYDSIHGVADTERRLAIHHPLLAEVLQAAGYSTAGFYSGPFLHPGYGFAYGFDEYVNCTHDPDIDEVDLERLREGRDEFHHLSNLDITNPRIFEEVSLWMSERMEEPFFLFIHYWDVHHDYIPPEPYDRMFDPEYEGDLDVSDFEHNDGIHPNMDPRDLQHLIALYDGEIRWTDEWIGKLMGLLAEMGILDRTLVIVTSDHGEEFFEHNRKGHRKNLHDETIRVPLIFRLPPKVRAGHRIPDQVRLIDIYPTVLEVVGVDLREGLLGKSLVPFLDGDGDAPIPPSYSELTVVPGEAVGQRVLRTLDAKLIRFASTGENIFYDLLKDPLELSPVPAASIERGREAMERMDRDWEALDALRATLQETAADPTFEPDPELIDHLRSLGYIK
jgi:arylsulfatase A-like enzyme